MQRPRHLDLILLVFAVVLLLFSAEIAYDFGPFWLLVCTRTALVVFIQVLGGYVFYRRVIKNTGLTVSRKNRWLCFYACFFVFFTAEFIFTFIPKSNNLGMALSHKVWRYYYDRPINSHGFRDAPVELYRVRQPNLIAAVGDSFTYGAGIKDYRLRYTNVLQSLVGRDYRVVNIANGGNDTLVETHNFMRLGISPGTVIYQYYGNDIDGAALMEGFDIYQAQRPPPGLRFLVENSFFLNFLYAHLPRDFGGYEKMIISFYEDAALRARHFQDVANLLSFFKSKGIRVVVVIFPYMTDLQKSRTYIGPLTELLEEKGVAYIDVSALVADLDVKERIIHALDTHPSPAVHRRVAEALYRKMKEMNIVD